MSPTAERSRADSRPEGQRPSRRVQYAGRLAPQNDLGEGTMKILHRRQFLHLAAATAALPLASRLARAQAYPSRPVRIVVGFPPGGSNDTLARPMGQWLSQRLGRPFI